MRAVLSVFARFSLVLLTVPSFLFLAGGMNLPTVKLLMLIATVVWFACTLPGIRQD